MISQKILDKQLPVLPKEIKFCRKCVVSNQRQGFILMKMVYVEPVSSRTSRTISTGRAARRCLKNYVTGSEEMTGSSMS